MLEEPGIQDTAIQTCLQQVYGLSINRVEFLPLDHDRNSAVYRAETEDTTYFIKLRRGDFDAMTTQVPKLLHEQDIQQIIAPLVTQSDPLWADIGEFKLSVFPYIEGLNAYEVEMEDHHWVAFGLAFKNIHSAAIPTEIKSQIQQETFSDKYRVRVRELLQFAQQLKSDDSLSDQLAAFLCERHNDVLHLVEWAETLAAVLKTQACPICVVPCRYACRQRPHEHQR